MRDTVQREFKLGEFFENWGYDTADGRVAGLDNYLMTVNGVDAKCNAEPRVDLTLTRN